MADTIPNPNLDTRGLATLVVTTAVPLPVDTAGAGTTLVTITTTTPLAVPLATAQVVMAAMVRFWLGNVESVTFANLNI